MPKQCEVLVIGGGIIGSFVAYWIRTLAPNLNVAVIEKDNNVRVLVDSVGFMLK